MDIIGEIGLRLRAIGDTFKQEAAEVAQQGTKDLKVEVPVTAADIDVKKIQALDQAIANVSAGKARLAGVKAELKEVTDFLVNARSAQAMVPAETFARSFYAQDLPAMERREAELRRQIFLEEELAIATRIRAREALKASQTPSLPPGEKAGGGLLGKVGEFGRASGRTGGLGGLIAVGSRLGLIGFAATAAFTAVGELQQSLRVTGDDAFTTEGKLRNLGAELLGGNIIGGIKALVAERKAVIAQDIAGKLEEEKQKTDPLFISEEKLMTARRKGRKELEQYLGVLLALDKINVKQFAQLLKVTEELYNQEAAAMAAAQALSDYAEKVRQAGSEAAAFGPDSRGGAQGVGGVTQGNLALQAQGGPTIQPGTGGAAVAATIRASITSRIKDNVERANLEARDARITQKLAKTAFDNVKASGKHTDQAAKEWAAYVAATTDVVLKTRAAQEATKQAAATAQALGDSVRVSIANRASSDEAVQAALLDAARISEKNARAAFEAARHTKEAGAAYAAWQAAITARVIQEKTIAATAKAAAEAAAQSATNARESKLANDIAAAELAGDIPAQRRAINAYIAYWRGIANDVRKSDEIREAARSQIISLTGALKGLGDTSGFRQAKIANDIAEAELKGLDTKPLLRSMVAFAKRAMDLATQGTEAFEAARSTWISAKQNLASYNNTLNELKRANARARAALTESEEDDERLIRAEIARLEKKVKATKGLGIVHQKAIAELLSARQDLEGLVEEIKPTTTVFDLLTKSTERFTEFAGNVINASNRFNADTFTAGIRGRLDNAGVGPSGADRAKTRFEINDDRITRSLGENTTALNNNTAALRSSGNPLHRRSSSTADEPDASGNPMHRGTYSESKAARGARGGIS